MKREPIKLWRSADVPEELWKHIGDTSDIDWVALVPPGYENVYLPFDFEGGWFGCFAVEKYEHEGSMLYVGYHS